MQLTVRRAAAGATLALLALARPGAAQDDGSSLRLLTQHFSDSKQVAVHSAIADYTLALPRAAVLTLHWNHERVTIPAVAAPPGTQEAVDAITTASRPIAGDAFRDFVKVREELQGGLAHGGARVEYYRSNERDFLGQQVAASYGRDLAGRQLNLSVGTSYGWDAIAPLADDDTQTAPGTRITRHLNAVATRALTTTTILRVGLERSLVSGLQHNPYRNVYAGGTRVPEAHPDRRERRDAFVRLHQYLRNRSSLKLAYRLYDDDWGIQSHTVDGELSQYVTRGLFASYAYRYYRQSPADFHRDEYPTVDGVGGYRTGDYRMGRLASHLFGAALDLDLAAMAVEHPVFGRLGLRLDIERYFNSNNYSADFLTAQVTCRL